MALYTVWLEETRFYKIPDVCGDDDEDAIEESYGLMDPEFIFREEVEWVRTQRQSEEG